MAEFSYPYSSAANDRLSSESSGLAFGPDAIVSGLDVSVVGANVVRLGPGFARCGGWAYENTSNLDFAVTTNGSANPRVDRLVLRKTWDGANLVQVRAAVLAGSPAVDPTYPTLLSGRGPGSTWHSPVALWAVAGGSGSSAVVNLRTNGRGPGSVSWDLDNSIPTGLLRGWDLTYSPTGLGNHGPQPITWRSVDKVLPVLIGGIYSVTYGASIAGAGAASEAYIRMDGPAGFPWSAPFDQRNRAQISMCAWMDEGEVIFPTVYHNLGSTRTASLSLAITRLT